MLRIQFFPHWLQLSDFDIHEVLYDSRVKLQSVGIEDRVNTKILNSGLEFSKHKEMRRALEALICFAHP